MAIALEKDGGKHGVMQGASGKVKKISRVTVQLYCYHKLSRGGQNNVRLKYILNATSRQVDRLGGHLYHPSSLNVFLLSLFLPCDRLSAFAKGFRKQPDVFRGGK